MPALRDKGIALLASISGVDMKTAAATTIFTTPAGKVTRIAYIVIRDPSASLVGGTNYAFGTGFRNNTAVDLSSLTTANTDYIVLANHTNVGNDQKSTEIAANTAFAITVTTGSTGAATASIDVFGYTT
jgi:hypothetical protein